MKDTEISRDVVFSSAAKFRAITRGDQIGPELLGHAAAVATGMAAYAVERPTDALRLTFLLLGHPLLSPGEQLSLQQFLGRIYSPAMVAPLAEAAIASLYAGPKRPDDGMHQTADVLHGLLGPLDRLNSPLAELAADALLMHSDARPQRKDNAAKVKKTLIQSRAAENLAAAGMTANTTVIGGGSAVTPGIKDVLRFMAENLDAMSAVDEHVGMTTPRTVLYYATPGSAGRRWAEDRLHLLMLSTARIPDPAEQILAAPIAIALAEAGDHERQPAQTAMRYLRIVDNNLAAKDKDPQVRALLASTPAQRERMAEATRRSQRNNLRNQQAERIPCSPKESPADLRNTLIKRAWASAPAPSLN
jgi:hypothetical protein